jgi:hypothetical protein
MDVLKDAAVRAALRRAWDDSRPGSPEAHEEGGFVLLEADGAFSIERWPRGGQDQIEVPEYANGLRRGRPIVATFHTHPNPAPEYDQKPSLTDIRAVRDDLELHHLQYVGELVVAAEMVYLILPNGQVGEIGSRIEVLGPS